MKSFKEFISKENLNEVKIKKVGDSMRDTSGRASEFEAMLADARKRSMARDSATAKSLKSELEKQGLEVGKVKDDAIMLGNYALIITSPGGNIEVSVNANGKEVKSITGSSVGDVAKQLKTVLNLKTEGTDHRKLGQQGRYDITDVGRPAPGEVIDYYDRNGDKRSGKVKSVNAQNVMTLIDVGTKATVKLDLIKP